MAQELRHQLHIMFYMKVPRSDHQLRLLTLTNVVLPGEAATWPGQLVLINQLGGLNNVPGFQCQSLNHLGTLESEMGVENSWFVKNVHGQKAGSWWKNIKRKLGADAKAKTRTTCLTNQYTSSSHIHGLLLRLGHHSVVAFLTSTLWHRFSHHTQYVSWRNCSLLHKRHHYFTATPLFLQDGSADAIFKQ